MRVNLEESTKKIKRKFMTNPKQTLDKPLTKNTIIALYGACVVYGCIGEKPNYFPFFFLFLFLFFVWLVVVVLPCWQDKVFLFLSSSFQAVVNNCALPRNHFLFFPGLEGRLKKLGELFSTCQQQCRVKLLVGYLVSLLAR